MTYTPYELGKQYDTTSQEAKRTHYPHLLAPPSLRTANLPSTRPQRYLNPALWDAVTLGNKTAESQLQAYMWQTESACNPTRTFTPDSVTTYDYDYDNRLITVNLPTNNDTVEYTYDATGRRLTKEYAYHNGANTDVTTYKYHYIGSQITEIEINAIRNPGESQTTLRDEEIKIHLGANSQPISYEWVKHISGNTTSATYYYHYDIHGNVLKITDSSENTKITYTYDVLGKILTESNPDSVLNFFTFRGASQTIWEPETGLYYSGGYYRPDTGTALQGTGAPVLTNPASGAMLNAVAQATAANAQLAAQAAVAASTAGSSSGGKPGGFAPPSGSSDGFAHAGNQGPPMNTDSLVQIDNSVFDSSPLLSEGWRPIIVEGEDYWNRKPYVRRSNEYGIEDDVKDGKDEGDGTITPSFPPKPGDPGYVTPLPVPPADYCSLTDEEKEILLNSVKNSEIAGTDNSADIDINNGTITVKDKNNNVLYVINVKDNLVACAFAYNSAGTPLLMCYYISDPNMKNQIVFYQYPDASGNAGEAINPSTFNHGSTWESEWENYTRNGGYFNSYNTGDDIVLYLAGEKDTYRLHGLKFYFKTGAYQKIKPDSLGKEGMPFNFRHADIYNDKNNFLRANTEIMFKSGGIYVCDSKGNFKIFENGKVVESWTIITSGYICNWFFRDHTEKAVGKNDTDKVWIGYEVVYP